MRYGIFSDVHSNAEAFLVVLEEMRMAQVDHYVFLGDLVGYAAEPKQCIEILKELSEKFPCTSVAGNHDYAVCGLTDYAKYTRYAVEAIEWTKKQLTEPEMAFLAQLQRQAHVDGFTIVHANLESNGEWGYILDIDDAYINFQYLKDRICFIGHTHRPVTFVAGDSYDWFVSDQMKLLKENKYIINIGSVGQPRDGNPFAAFAIYDDQEESVEILRVEYDVAMTQQKILQAGLPAILAQRLECGI